MANEKFWTKEEWEGIEASALEIFRRLLKEAAEKSQRSNKRRLSVQAVQQAIAERKALDAQEAHANDPPGDFAHFPNLPGDHPANITSQAHWNFPGNASRRREALQITIETLQRELNALGGPLEPQPPTPRCELELAFAESESS